MHASWYHVYTAQIERQKDLIRQAQEDRRARSFRRASRKGEETASFERSLARFVRDGLRLAMRAPGLARSFARAARIQRRGARLRATWKARGVSVPPLMIASITEACNLRCNGCYARERQGNPERELSLPRWSGLFREASQLGVSFVLVAGGEPFARCEVIEAAGSVPGVLFAVFTNGLLIGPQALRLIKRSGNIVPIVSVEGPERQTDERRGFGVYTRVMQSMARMRRAGLVFGASITVTRANLEAVTDPAFIDSLLDAGCRLVVFVEFAPVEQRLEALALAFEQRAQLCERARAFHRRGRALFITFPGDEEQYGGCLAAGRGFVHVSAQGELEPCPFAPFSDASVRDQSLAKALGSPLLAEIRANHTALAERSGGCALRVRNDWVRTLLDRQAAQLSAREEDALAAAG